MFGPRITLTEEIKREKNKLLILIVILSFLAITKLFDSALAKLFINDLM